VKRDGISFHLDISDYVDHFLFFGFCDNSRNKLYSFVKSGMIIFDIGANMGDTALHFAKLIGEKGAVLAFEPDEKNYKRATRNISANEMTNISLHNIGLGHLNGTLKLYRVNSENLGMNRILNTPSDLPYKIIEVQKLDDYISKNKISKIDLIKIDVEGFEMNVLKGASGLLKTIRPLLFIEIDEENLKEQNSSTSSLIDYLNELGYLVYHSETNRLLTIKDNFSNCHFDIYALPV
jgi:FkbM family methyltransferase